MESYNLKISLFNQRINSEQEIKNFELEFNLSLPEELKNILLSYEGAKLKDDACYFEYETGMFYELNQFLYLRNSIDGGASIENIFLGHKSNNVTNFIPFAIDSGGWDYNINIAPNHFGEIWINKFDSDDENTFKYVCQDMKTFLANLKSDI